MKIQTAKNLVMTKQVDALQKAAKAKHEAIVNKTKAAIDALQKSGRPINFQSVAKFAGISKTSLYSDPELYDLIKSLRGSTDSIKRSSDLQLLLQKKDTQIKELEAKLDTQNKNVAKLKKQLEIAYGELYKKEN